MAKVLGIQFQHSTLTKENAEFKRIKIKYKYNYNSVSIKGNETNCIVKASSTISKP